MIKLSRTEALDYWRKGYVVIIRSKELEDFPAIMQDDHLCRYDDPIEGEPINELLTDGDKFYYDENLNEEYYQLTA